MNSLRSAHNPILLVLFALAALWLGTAPVHASVEADFNGDGVLDAIDVQHVPNEQLVVRLSGAPPQILPVRGRILTIVATDFNHDGKLDITAVSERRGVLIWLNSRRGRFNPVARRVHSRALRWSRKGGTAQRRGGEEREGGQAAGDQPQDAVAAGGGFGSCPVPPLSHRVVLRARSARSADFLPANSTRAPPFSFSYVNL
jgi:hypothetical protein